MQIQDSKRYLYVWSASELVRRKYIQVVSAILYNANFKGFISGTIYKGDIKSICAPGLNCYSCPGAVAACPLGSLQAALGEVKYKLPFYIAGTLLLFGVLLGRGVCAFLCPFGLIQELLYKIPTPKLHKSKATQHASMGKYVILAVFVIFLPLFFLVRDGVSVPAFCKFICPVGTLEAGIPLVLANERLRAFTGGLFGWKVIVLAGVIISSVFIYRIFCRFLCPLGAIYSLFNRWALFGITVNEVNCTRCNACVNSCKLDTRKINDRECIRCGECHSRCKNNAIIIQERQKGYARTKKARVKNAR